MEPSVAVHSTRRVTIRDPSAARHMPPWEAGSRTWRAATVQRLVAAMETPTRPDSPLWAAGFRTAPPVRTRWWRGGRETRPLPSRAPLAEDTLIRQRTLPPPSPAENPTPTPPLTAPSAAAHLTR